MTPIVALLDGDELPKDLPGEAYLCLAEIGLLAVEQSYESPDSRSCCSAESS